MLHAHELEQKISVWKRNIAPSVPGEHNAMIPIEIANHALFAWIQWEQTKKSYNVGVIQIKSKTEYTRIQLNLDAVNYFRFKRFMRSLGVKHLTRVTLAGKKKQISSRKLYQLFEPTLVNT